MSGFWAAMSLIFAVISLPLALIIVKLRESGAKNRRRARAYSAESTRIACAAIATDLIPLLRGLKKHVEFKSSELWIFGSDGRYIIDANQRGWKRLLPRILKKWTVEKWRKEFRLWTADGLSITYILLEADDEVRELLTDLKKDLGEGFDAFILREGAIEDEIQALWTYHPTLFLGANGENAAWIEGWHPPDSIYAYDVTYIPPKAMRRAHEKEVFEACEARLSLVKENSERLVS